MEEPRQLGSQSSAYPTKSMTFMSDDDEPPAYVNELPRTRDQYSRTRPPRAYSWRDLGTIPSVYSPPPSRGRDYSPHAPTMAAEVPLRPNRRADPEFGGGPSPASQVLLPISANSRPKRTKSSGDGSLGKNWLKNFKSPIGESSWVFVRLVC